MDYTKLHIKDEAHTRETFELRRDENGVLFSYPKPLTLNKYYSFENYISHKSDSNSLTHKVYNLVKRRMFLTKLNLLQRHTSNLKRVLDFGCGTGEFVKYLKSKQIEAEGYEPTKLAYQKALNQNILVFNDLERISSNYDAITMFHVLEHVNNYQDTINQLRAKLNPNGLLVIAVPNYKAYDAAYYKEKWAAWDVPRHLWHFCKKDIENIAKQNGFKMLSIHPMYFDAFYISMVSESYKGNPKLFGLWNGLISNMKAMKTEEYSSNIFVLQKSR